MSTDDPTRPYQGSSGHSGSDTSRERAERRDGDGTTGKAAVRMFSEVALRGGYGLTCHEAQQRLGIGHGSASWALSVLHKAGKIARLEDRRVGQHVYVTPAHVNGRPLSPYRRQQSRVVLRERIATLEASLASLLLEFREGEWASDRTIAAQAVLDDRLED
jgi:DNA-binding transcriptional ArsR family regulator